jgi:hypothetical protein
VAHEIVDAQRPRIQAASSAGLALRTSRLVTR